MLLIEYSGVLFIWVFYLFGYGFMYAKLKTIWDELSKYIPFYLVLNELMAALKIYIMIFKWNMWCIFLCDCIILLLNFKASYFSWALLHLLIRCLLWCIEKESNEKSVWTWILFPLIILWCFVLGMRLLDHILINQEISLQRKRYLLIIIVVILVIELIMLQILWISTL